MTADPTLDPGGDAAAGGAVARAWGGTGVVVLVRALPAPTPGDEAVLDDRERDRAGRFRFAHDRDRYVAAHAWLRRILGELTGTDPAAVTLVVPGRGRPTLPAGPAFSLAHAGDVVAVAVADAPAVGVDVETVPDLVDLDAAALVLGPAEVDAARRDGPPAFARAWTRKEAWVKCTGEGLHDGLRTVDLLDDRAPDGTRLRTFPSVAVGTGTDAHVVSLAAPVSLAGARLEVRP